MAWFFVGAGRNASGTENINELLINQALREVGEPTRRYVAKPTFLDYLGALYSSPSSSREVSF